MKKNILLSLNVIALFFINISAISCRGSINEIPVINRENQENHNNVDDSNKDNNENNANDEDDQDDKKGKKSDPQPDSNNEKKPFIFVWNVNESGEFALPINELFKYDYKFDLKWCRMDGSKICGEKLNLDGRFSNRYDGRYQIAVSDLPGAGKYLVEMTGIFPAFRFGNSLNTVTDQILEIRQWGSLKWKTMEKAFYGCKYLNITAQDAPDLSEVKDMSYMFYKASSLNSDINHWNVSNVTNMAHLFEKAKSFNQPLDKWNVGNVENMNHLFSEAVSFDRNIESWDVSKVTDMGGMFSGALIFDEPIGKWNVSNVVNMSEMFKKAEMFNQSLNNWKINSNVNLNEIFVGARYFNKNNIKDWNISNKKMF